MISITANGQRRLRNANYFAILLGFLGLATNVTADVVLSNLPANVPTKTATIKDWLPLSDTIFEQLDHDHGLTSQVGVAITEDGDGFLWMGSEGGLARWDGYHFRFFFANLNDTNSLPVSRIQTLFTDSRGRMWIGTHSAGLVRYDHVNERFIRIPVGPNSISHVHVSAIANDGKGGIWVGTDNGLDHLDPDTGFVTHWKMNESGENGLPDNIVQALQYAHDGTLWVGTAKGLVKIAPDGTSLVDVFLPTSGDSPPSVVSLFEASDGRIWGGTTKFGAFVVDPSTNFANSIHPQDMMVSSPNMEWIRSIAEVLPGIIWLGTEDSGIVEYNVASGSFRHLHHDPNVATSLADDAVWNIKINHAGLVWVGTQRGISRYDPSHDAIRTITGGGANSHFIADADIESVLSTIDGEIWLGLRKNGINILDADRQQVRTIRPDPSRPEDALPQTVVNAMTQMSNGKILIGTDRGLYQAESSGTKVSRLSWTGRNPDIRIDTLLMDGQHLWLGSVVDGLWQVEVGAKVSGKRPSWITKLSDQHVNVIIQAASGGLWIGTDFGLNYVFPDTGSVEQLLFHPGVANSLSSGEISSLRIARNGDLWVGTFGGGINIIDNPGQSGQRRFRHVSTADGIPSANIDQLLEDPAGMIWASTDSGLAIVDPSNYSVRALHRGDGVFIMDYWSNSGAVSKAGDLVFGGLGGITAVRPSLLHTWNYTPPLALTDARIGGQSVPASRFNGKGDSLPLTVNPESNSIAIEFAALDYSEPELNNYAYRLDGFDHDWIYTDSNRRLAAYTNLPPGDFQLRLKGSNRDGTWTKQELIVPIRVFPAWYQTYWIRLVEILLGLGVIYAVIWFRTKRLRSQKVQLEIMVLDRVKELACANTELERLAHHDPLTGLGNRRRFFSKVSDHLSLAKRHHKPCCVMMVDLDNFKKVNDTFGHAGGDATLLASAKCLVSCVREIDVTARFGGEEFAVFFSGMDISNSREVAERFRQSLEALEIEFEGCIIRITASIGISDWKDNEAGIEPALDRADAALYRVKESGRNGIELA